MGKGLIIAGIAGALIVAAVAAYFAFGRPSSTSTATPVVSTQTESTPSSASSEPKSLKDLMSLGQNQNCSFRDETGNSGSVYVNSGRVRGDFASTINGKLENSHMIVDGQYAYIWMDSLATGFKVSQDTLAQVDQTSVKQSVDIDKKLDFECNPWSVDASVFVVPTTIEFTDYSAMLAPAVTGAATQTTGDSTQCAACQNLSGTYRDQCLQALSCN